MNKIFSCFAVLFVGSLLALAQIPVGDMFPFVIPGLTTLRRIRSWTSPGSMIRRPVVTALSGCGTVILSMDGASGSDFWPATSRSEAVSLSITLQTSWRHVWPAWGSIASDFTTLTTKQHPEASGRLAQPKKNEFDPANLTGWIISSLP